MKIGDKKIGEKKLGTVPNYYIRDDYLSFEKKR